MSIVDAERKRPYRPKRELKAQIVRKGLSQTEVARRIGVSPQHLNAVLNGYEPLTERTARDIAFATGLPLSVVLGGDGDGQPAPVGQ